jgi:hypothetical protein
MSSRCSGHIGSLQGERVVPISVVSRSHLYYDVLSFPVPCASAPRTFADDDHALVASLKNVYIIFEFQKHTSFSSTCSR